MPFRKPIETRRCSDGLFLFSSESSDIESVPDVGYQTQTVKLFGRYKVQPDFAVQLDVVGERWKTNDWQWADYVYSDGTTLSQDSDQNVLFIGLTGIVTWR